MADTASLGSISCDLTTEVTEFTTELIYDNLTAHQADARRLNIIHFNDVYNIESRDCEPVGGASRFVTAIESLQQKGPTLVLFSGDAIMPSSVSILVKGKQMIEILNKCHLACACLGNHDFDLGMDVLIQRIHDSNFPWVISNVFDQETKKPLGGVPDRHIVELNGVKIGIIALIEQEWMATLSTLNFDDVIYESFIENGKKLATELKENDKCDIVIALTHMRWPNDNHLAENVPEIDLILGGHDHDYVVNKLNNRWIVKSGTDFRELSLIEVSVASRGADGKVRNPDDQVVTKIEKYVIDSKIPPKLDIQNIVDSYLENLNKELEVVLGSMNVELDGRFSAVRTRETNLGNFICDIMLASVNADCAILNSGSLRSDCIHPVGDFRVKDLKKILPYLDESVVISCTGAQLHQALENAVSQYPKLEGRFPQVSGIRFAFDPRKTPGQRIDPKLIKIQDEYLIYDKEYSLITKLYLKQGKDGFDCLMNCPVLIDEENIPVLVSLVENHFKTIQTLQTNRFRERFRSSIVPLFIVNKLINKLSEDPTILRNESPVETPSKLNFHNAAFLITKVLSYKQKTLSKKQRLIIKQSDTYRQMMKEYESKSMQLSPQVEGRIVCIRDDNHLEELIRQKQEELKQASS